MSVQTFRVDGPGGVTMEAVMPRREALAALSVPELVGRFRGGVERFDPRVFQLDAERADMSFLPEAGVGRLSCRALLAHLMDAELVYAFRIRRALAEESPLLELWDEQAFMDSPLYGGEGEATIRTPLGGMAATVHAIRMTMGATLYQLDNAQWQRRAMHPERGPMTVRDLVEVATWHIEHHAVYLNAKVFRFLGVPEQVDCDTAMKQGGCGAGCGCKAEADAASHAH